MNGSGNAISAVVGGSQILTISNDADPTVNIENGDFAHLDATGQIGFFNTTKKAQSAAIVKLTDGIAGTITDALAAVPDPADLPATADALRDDLVNNVLPAIRNALSSIADDVNKFNDLLSAVNGTGFGFHARNA